LVSSVFGEVVQGNGSDLRPFTFLLLVIGLTWIPWLTAIVIVGGTTWWFTVLLIAVGGLGPTVAAVIMFRQTPDGHPVRKDLLRRLIDPRSISPKGYFFVFAITPLIVVAAVIVSVIFGHSVHQLSLTPELRTTLWSIVPFAIFVLFFGPIPEEIGW
jgi:membrane protease YdiL (CAAX protease family)